MRQTGNGGEPRQRIQVPRHKTKRILGQRGENPNRSDRNHIAECDHQRGDKNRHQYQGFEMPASRHVRAYHEERKQRPERDRDPSHAGGKH